MTQLAGLKSVYCSIAPRTPYRGELYDIAFDKPQTHVVEKNGVMPYVFYAPSWDGAVTLRGLGAGVWRVRDYVNDVDRATSMPSARP